MGFIHESASVKESYVSEDARIFKNAFIRSCRIGAQCLVGDSSRLEDSDLGFFVWIYPNGMVYSSQIGDYSYTQKNSSLWHCSVGKFSSISWNVSIGGGEHDFNRITSHSILYASMYGFIDEPLYNRFAEKCVIGNDVWIGAGAHILRGVTIGNGAVIAANAVVTQNVEPYSIVAGVPARKIGQRCEDKLIEKMQKLQWWNMPGEMIKKNIDLLGCKITEKTVDQLIKIKGQCFHNENSE